MKALANREEIGALLHRKPDTIYRWARRGFIPSVSVGEEFVFDLHEVARWAEFRGKMGRTDRSRHKARRMRG